MTGTGNGDQAGLAVEEPEEFHVFRFYHIVQFAVKEHHGHIVIRHHIGLQQFFVEAVGNLHLPFIAADNTALLQKLGFVHPGNGQEGFVHPHRRCPESKLHPAQHRAEVIHGIQAHICTEAGGKHGKFLHMGIKFPGQFCHCHEATLAVGKVQFPGGSGAFAMTGEVEDDGGRPVEIHFFRHSPKHGAVLISAESVNTDDHLIHVRKVRLIHPAGNVHFAPGQKKIAFHKCSPQMRFDNDIVG